MARAFAFLTALAGLSTALSAIPIQKGPEEDLLSQVKPIFIRSIPAKVMTLIGYDDPNEFAQDSEFGLTQQEYTAINEIVGAVIDKSQKVFLENFKKIDAKNDEDLQKKANELVDSICKVIAGMESDFLKPLSSKKQKRFEQIATWIAGPGCLVEDQRIQSAGTSAILKKISLDAQQKKRLVDLVNQFREALADYRRPDIYDPMDEQQVKAAYAKDWQTFETFDQKILQVLTPTQRKVWEQYRGSKFRMAQPKW
ncbi:MAG: hypothetical protein JST40_08900 [Armatimonadetes bacterium]|nr:hypothetical protein [Armatimonadota bacterium]